MFTDDCFSVLASLAALDEASADELRHIASHLERCSQCRLTFGELDSELRNPEPKAGRSWLRGWLPEIASKAESHKSRFLSRAKARGIQFSNDVWRDDSKRRLGYFLWKASFAAGTVGVFVLAFVLLSHVRAPQSSARGQNASGLGETNQELSRKLTSANLEWHTIETSLSAARLQIAAEKERKQKLESEITVLQKQISQLEAAQLKSAQRESELEASAHSAETLSSQASLELQKTRDAEDQAVASLTEQQYRIAELSKQLEIANTKLTADTELLAANKDIRDVMGARNLHLIDVQDVEGGGRMRKTFGRIFYAEGKTLTFYVFNPGDRVLEGRDTLQAWGYREPAASKAQSLGIFYRDDDKLKRWVLKFDDPKVLERIDAVFVTLEPSGGAKDPSRKKLLYAYLNQEPNHP